MKTMTTMIMFWMTVASALLGAAPTMAQHITGEPGSPSATIQIDGKQLPPPDPKFGGGIRDAALESKPWWAPRVVPPQGAPNVLLIITDDAGFGVPSTFGGVIPTPSMDRIAQNGLRYNNFSGLAQPGTGTLKVDGKVVATKKMERTLPMILQWDESFDIGSDTLTGVNDEDYRPPFPLTAKLNKLTIKVDHPQLSPEDIKKLQAAMKEKAKRD